MTSESTVEQPPSECVSSGEVALISHLSSEEITPAVNLTNKFSNHANLSTVLPPAYIFCCQLVICTEAHFYRGRAVAMEDVQQKWHTKEWYKAV